jgi:hypothetical protein
VGEGKGHSLGKGRVTASGREGRVTASGVNNPAEEAG